MVETSRRFAPGPEVFAALLLAAIAAFGLTKGISSQEDARSIVETSVPAILRGGYVPSRSFGNPLFEYAAAAIIGLSGSERAAQVYSLVLGAASVLVLGRIVADQPYRTRALVAFGYALSALILINASALIEWTQAALLTNLVLLSAQSWFRERKASALVGYGASTAALTLTRPDYALVAVVVFAAVAWAAQFRRRIWLPMLLSGMAAAASAAVLFLLLSGSAGLGAGMAWSSDPLSRRAIRAVLGFVAVFGPLGCLVLLPVGYSAARLSFSGRDGVWSRTFILLAPLLLVRFAQLPDKLEYILPLVPVSLLAAAETRPRITLGLLALSLVSVSVVAVHLFRRGDGDALALAPGIDKGALFQDWEVSAFDDDLRDPAFLKLMSELIYPPAERQDVAAPIFGIGLVSTGRDLIIGRPEFYRLDNPRFAQPIYDSATYRRIYVCDKSLGGLRAAWRVLQPSLIVPRPDLEHGSTDLACELMRP